MTPATLILDRKPQRASDCTRVVGRVKTSEAVHAVRFPQGRERRARIAHELNEARAGERRKAAHVAFVLRRLLDPSEWTRHRRRRRMKCGYESKQRGELGRDAAAQRRMPPYEEARELYSRAPRYVAPAEPEVRREIRIDKARDPLGREAVESRARWRRTSNVRKRSEIGSFARQDQEFRMAVEQRLQQRRAAAVVPTDENGPEQPLERQLTFVPARRDGAEHTRFACRRGGVVGERCQQLRSSRRSGCFRQQAGDRGLHAHPVGRC
jgi:hypothetical protein